MATATRPLGAVAGKQRGSPFSGLTDPHKLPAHNPQWTETVLKPGPFLNQVICFLIVEY